MLDLWGIFSTLTKYGAYIGIAGVFGFTISIALKVKLSHNLNKVMFWLSLTGLLCTILYFFLQVGAFADNGLAGMFDKNLMALLFNTANGELLVWRGAALGYFFLMMVFLGNKLNLRSKKLGFIVLAPPVLALMWSFTTLGHVANANWYWQAFLMLHIFVALSWAGSLKPLSCYLGSVGHGEAVTLLERYSSIGIVLVSLLFISGTMLIAKLIFIDSNFDETKYLATLSLKLLLVAIMLGYAAHHKFRLSVKLKAHEVDKDIIIKSVSREHGVARLVLLITAVLTTLVGISH